MTDFDFEIIDVDRDNITVRFFSSALEAPITVMLPREAEGDDDTVFGLNLVCQGHYK